VPWARFGDNAATYPALLDLAGDPEADERTVNEVMGFLARVGTLSGAHLTDYVVDFGTAQMVGGSRTRELIRLCESTGLMEPTKTSSGRAGWRIVQDPEFLHLRLREEIEHTRQRARDTTDVRLKVPVLLRDGDQCRWCGVLTMWRGRTSNRTGTLDHLVPGQPGTVETLAVACKGCNSARGGNTELWDDNHELRPTPKHPRYGKATAKLLTDNGWPTEPNVHSDDESALKAAAGSAPTSGVRPAAPTANRPALTSAPSPEPSSAAPSEAAPAKPVQKSPGNVSDRSPGMNSPGSGRDGSGSRSGDHRVGGPPGSGVPSGGRRNRRGKRGGKRNSQAQGRTQVQDPPAWANENEGGAA